MQKITITGSKNRVQKHYESKNNLRTFQAENIEMFKNSQLQINFTGRLDIELRILHLILIDSRAISFRLILYNLVLHVLTSSMFLSRSSDEICLSKVAAILVGFVKSSCKNTMYKPHN